MAQGDNSNISQDMAKVEEQQRLKYLEFVQPDVETVEGTVKSVVRPVYDKYHDVPVELLKFVDTKLDESVTRLEKGYKVASVVVPTAAYCSDKYNQTVVGGAEKGYKVAAYLPLVPTEKIAKVFSEQRTEMEPLVSES
ncbi:hypothetical protein HRI_004941700 [Hibiscus trionum]|uniref:Uncharacterized protein n=1 Tax=Hibiscus trionum TaxID=183268 RepID=A0A9W7JDV6_HIBTR|nr:hypothetical protein HRI_004941700 [Hibiscus trionum]